MTKAILPYRILAEQSPSLDIVVREVPPTSGLLLAPAPIILPKQEKCNCKPPGYWKRWWLRNIKKTPIPIGSLFRCSDCGIIQEYVGWDSWYWYKADKHGDKSVETHCQKNYQAQWKKLGGHIEEIAGGVYKR